MDDWGIFNIWTSQNAAYMAAARAYAPPEIWPVGPVSVSDSALAIGNVENCRRLKELHIHKLASSYKLGGLTKMPVPLASRLISACAIPFNIASRLLISTPE